MSWFICIQYKITYLFRIIFPCISWNFFMFFFDWLFTSWISYLLESIGITQVLETIPCSGLSEHQGYLSLHHYWRMAFALFPTLCFIYYLLPSPAFLKKQDFPIYLRLACHSLCSPGCTRTSASPLSSAAEVLELQPRATTSGSFLSFFKMIFKVQTCSGLENLFLCSYTAWIMAKAL